MSSVVVTIALIDDWCLAFEINDFVWSMNRGGAAR